MSNIVLTTTYWKYNNHSEATTQVPVNVTQKISLNYLNHILIEANHY